MLIKLLGVVRAPFLLLVPAVLAPAFAVAWRVTGAIDPLRAALVVAAALAAHIAVNALNEYQDFRSGLDFHTRRTPFSGGSGTLVDHAAFAPVALGTAVAALLVTVAIGLYFVWSVGPGLLIPGGLGLALIAVYTPWLNRFPLLCLLAPGAGFGLLMVNLAALVLTGTVPPAALAASVVVTCLVSNLLLVNQVPDAAADRRVGRRHAVIAWGLARVPLLYLALALVAGATLGAAVTLAWLPTAALMACLPLFGTLRVARELRRHARNRAHSPVPAMGHNVAITLITPLVLAAGVLV